MRTSESEPAEADKSLDRDFTTTDLDFASYLAVRGIDPVEVKPPLPNSFPNFATFVFAPSDSLHTAGLPISGSLERKRPGLKAIRRCRLRRYRTNAPHPAAVV